MPLPEFWYDLAAASSLLPLITSGHALVMSCFMMLPALFGGFANWLIPMMIGTDDMVFRRLNWLALILLLSSFGLLMAAVFLTSMLSQAAILLLMSLYCLAFSLSISAINFIATILVARTPFMKLRRMPPFVWSVLIASFLMVACVPVMSAALTLPLVNLVWNATDALPPSWGDLPVMMWFITHPELFILMLPAFGIISEIIATFAGGRLVMATMVKGSFVVIGGAGFVLWSETLLSSGNSSRYQDYFPLVLAALALPIAVIISSWLLTIWHGSHIRRMPMLWAMGFLAMLLVATMSILDLGISQPLEISAFVSHFHYLLGLSGVFAIFGGWYFWFSKISGYTIREVSGKLHFWLLFISVHLTFLPQHFGKMTHAPDAWGRWIEAVVGWQAISTTGAGLAALSLLLFFYGIIEAFIRKRPAATNPWGQGAIGLEWQFPLNVSGQEVVVPVYVRS